MNMIYVYVIQSIADPQKLYVGQTQNIENRIAEHNSGKSKYTQTWRPWKVIYQEQFENRADARKREVYLKSTAGKNFLRKIKIVD
ncbi:MAG: GIY-YIG nuclease family protein [Bacteroidota bacterium]